MRIVYKECMSICSVDENMVRDTKVKEKECKYLSPSVRDRAKIKID